MQYEYGLRQRTPMAARRATQLPERLQETVAAGERAIREPFRGITTGGSVIPGLYPIAATGVSTEPIKTAAQRFLAALSPSQRAAAEFPVDSEMWQRCCAERRARAGIPDQPASLPLGH